MWYFLDRNTPAGRVSLEELQATLSEFDDDDEAPSAVASSPEPDVYDGNQGDAPVRPARFNNVIAKNWRGEYQLGVSFWIFGFLGNFILFALFILAALAPGTRDAPIVAFLVGSLVVGTWQVVGIWRSANRRIRERARLGKYAVWAWLAKIAVVLSVIRLVASFSNIGHP